MACKSNKTCASKMRHRITIVRRSLDTFAPHSVAPGHSYTTVLTTRAEIKTKGGTNEFNKVVIGKEEVSHTFMMRATSIAFDARDRVRNAQGELFKILKVEDVAERGDWLKIFAAKEGDETRKGTL